jgi:toxin secretion/phage lysis holin
MKHIVTDIISVILTTTIYLLGGLDVSLKSLLIIIVIDYVTGILSAIYNKNLNSKIGYKGIIKKFSYLFIIALSVIIDNVLGQTGTIRTLVIYFFVANDGLSILENVAEMNIPLPKKLVDTLEQLKKKGD